MLRPGLPMRRLGASLTPRICDGNTAYADEGHVDRPRADTAPIPPSRWGRQRVSRRSALFLKSATPSAAISKQEKGDHKGDDDQSDRTYPPARTHPPIQTSTTTK